MGVTQYIGARYVPLFAEPAEWDSTRAYEPLTIVLHNGNSYTSKQAVPIGIDIDNDKFWVLSANYNAQVETYRKETAKAVDTADASLETAKDAVSKVEAETTRATDAEKVLTDNLAAEVTRATDAEKVLTDNLTAEVTRATDAEKVLTDNLTAEVTRATDAEASNTKLINDEKTRASNSENELKSLVNDFACYKSVLAYGVSTSNTDNADAFQNALNDTAEKGWVLYIPNGTYKMSHSVTIPWYCHIEGQSKVKTVLKFASDAGFQCANDINNYKTCVGTTIRNLTIEGSYSGYATDPTSQPWYSDRHNATTMVPYSGIGGFFTMCCIEHIRITKFAAGLTFAQFVPSSDYNDKYNNIYGDLRVIRDIDVNYCNSGIWVHQWDYMVSGFDVSHCYWLTPVTTNGGFWENGHSWATNKAWAIIGGTTMNNVEVEAQYCFAISNGKQFDSCMYITNTSSSETVINNVRIWNLLEEVTGTGYYHGIFRVADDNTNDVIINNCSIGANPSYTTPSNYPTYFVETNGSCRVVFNAVVSPTITTIRGGTGYCFSGSAGVLSNIVSKNAFSSNAITIAGFNNASYEHV